MVVWQLEIEQKLKQDKIDVGISVYITHWMEYFQ